MSTNQILNTIAKHPPSLRIFFATEMWERYGFYVVQSLLALYMAFRFHWQDEQVYALVGSFTAMTYLSPIIGGWIADNLLGQKRTILVGAIILLFSYLALAFVSENFGLIVALAGIPVGTGLLKPNISSLLGNEYPINSPQRANGFTIFYMGITSGIILGTTLPSQLATYFNWPTTFISAAFGMVLAFSVFALGIKKYRITDYCPFNHRSINYLKASLLMGLLWLISFYILSYPHLADISFALIILLSFTYFVITVRRESSNQANQTIVIGLLCIISVMFWAFYFQMFLSLTLFISRTVEPTLFGLSFPPPYYVSIQSIGMLLFGYFMTQRKTKTVVSINSAQNGIQTGNKFLLAMLLMFMAYGLITYVSYQSYATALLSPLLIIPAYLLISVAELLLSPVGLAAVTSLASRHKVSTMMGIFFVSLGIGAFLSGKLANLTTINPEKLSIMELKYHYTNTFSQLFIILGVITLVCIVLNIIIKKLLLR